MCINMYGYGREEHSIVATKKFQTAEVSELDNIFQI